MFSYALVPKQSTTSYLSQKYELFQLLIRNNRTIKIPSIAKSMIWCTLIIYNGGEYSGLNWNTPNLICQIGA